MTVAALIVLSFANWRISSFLYDVGYDGPWNVLHKFRAAVGVRYDEYSQAYGTNMVSKGVLCPECCPIWVGVIQLVLYLASPALAVAMCLPFALGAISLLILKKSL